MKTNYFSSAFRLPVAFAAIGLFTGFVFAQASITETTPTSAPTTSTSSASTPSGNPFEVGERVVFAAIGLGSVYGVYGNQSIPPLSVGVDYAYQNMLTIGGVFGYSQSTWGYLANDIRYSYMTIAARGTFHPTMFLGNLSIPLDPYGAATVGYNIVSVSSSYTGYAGGVSYPMVGLSIGTRYWFTSNLAAQVEIGFGLGLLNLGISYKI
jgi:hypothetical protein